MEWTPTGIEKLDGYIDDVFSGRRCAGHYEIKAVERMLKDMERQSTEAFPYHLDLKAGMRYINFVERLLCHYKGQWAGRPMVLEGWQYFIFINIFGWLRDEDGMRRFTYADVEVARKNGKTTLAAAAALGLILIDKEPAAEVYAAAMDKEQAKICWESAKFIAQSSKMVRDEFKTYASSNKMVCPRYNSTFRPLSKDSETKDGLNPHGAICDERHAWKTNEMYEVLTSAIGARQQPLIFSISTAGRNLSYPYYKDVGKLKEILDGVIEQENQFVMIYELDKDDDWKDVNNWAKANPNLGKSIGLGYLKNEFQAAMNKGGTYLANFLTKNLNMWVDAPDVWIDTAKVEACNFGTDASTLLGRECYGGFDFASHVDIVSLSLFFPKANDFERNVILNHYWIPEGKINDDRVDYKLWRDMGWVTVTPGDVIDIDYIVSDIADILQEYDCQCIAFDPYKAYHGLIQGLNKIGLDHLLLEYAQSIRNMSEPTKEIERLVVAGDIEMMNDPVLRWMFGNVVIYTDPNNNIKMDKKRSANKIDGVVSFADAVGGYMYKMKEESNGTIYTNHTLRVLNI